MIHVHGVVYAMQHCLIRPVSDLPQVLRFLYQPKSPPRYYWNILEIGVLLFLTKQRLIFVYK